MLPKQEKKLQNTDIRKNRGLNQAGGAVVQTDTTYFKLCMPEEDYVLIC